MESVHKTDIVIVGAGPVGLFAVFQCGMLGLKAHVVEALTDLGGQCSALYPEKPIYDIPGFPDIQAGDLVERLEAQARPFSPVYHLGVQAQGVETEGEGFRISLSNGVDISCRAVIIAGGAGAFGPNRPPLEGLEACEGRSVFYMVRRRQDFAGKNVVIAGGGDSAVDWAVSLAEVAARVSVVHRRDKFRAAPESVARLHALAQGGAIDLVVPFQLQALDASDGVLQAVQVVSMEGQTRRIPADILLPFFGLAASLGPIESWGLAQEAGHLAVDPRTCATNRPGIFAIGDMATYPGKLKLILTGFAEAAHAAHAAWACLHPGQALHFEYSTTRGVLPENPVDSRAESGTR
ncbi:MAG: NAD(P)/FAD-dependent oxidoreductase [Rhodospirillales bacterium]|nr:NAD(P)/FAD-dependent oxidoreductase [Rhodospirillales bacterium]